MEAPGQLPSLPIPKSGPDHPPTGSYCIEFVIESQQIYYLNIQCHSRQTSEEMAIYVDESRISHH